jgi:hypothetical protein
MAAGIPGGDFRGIAHAGEAGYGLLSRYDLLTSRDGRTWIASGLDVGSDELLSLAGERNSFLLGTREGRIIRYTPGNAPVELPLVKDPFGRVVSPLKMIGVQPGGGDILVSSGQGIMISRDRGNTFQPVKDPFWSDPVSREIRALGYLGKTALIITGRDIYYSKGNEFLPSRKGLPPDVRATAFFIENKRALAAFAGIGIFQTSDGVSWKKLTRAPDDPVAFLGTTGKGVLAAGPFSPLYFGDAGGGTWTRVETISPGFAPVTSQGTAGRALLVLRGKGLYRVIKDNNMEPVDLPGNPASFLARHESSGVTLAGTKGGVFRSRDRTRWKDVTPAGLGAPVSDFLSLPDHRILLSTVGTGTFISADDGSTWSDWNEGLGTANSVTSLLLDADLVLASTENGLMQRALSGESAWQAADRGLARETVHKLEWFNQEIWAASSSGLYSAAGGGKFGLLRDLEGVARDISAGKDRLLALVDGSVYLIGKNGAVDNLGTTPDGTVPTSVALADGKVWAGTTAGVYLYVNGAWSRAWAKDYEIGSVQPENRGIRVVTKGAGTHYLK